MEEEEADKRRMEEEVVEELGVEGEEVREVGCKRRRLENHVESSAMGVLKDEVKGDRPTCDVGVSLTTEEILIENILIFLHPSHLKGEQRHKKAKFQNWLKTHPQVAKA